MPDVTFAPSAEDYAPGEEPAEFRVDDAPAADDAGDDADLTQEEALAPVAAVPAKESAEEEARRFGWVPKEEFRGPPGKWRSAEDFLEINNQSAPVLKERLRKMEETYNAKFQRLEATTQRAMELQRQQLEADFQARLAQAKADGDVDEVERLVANRPQIDDGPPSEAMEFVERNPWFMTDPALHQIAVGIEQRLVTSKPTLSVAERLEETERQMAALYPDIVKAPAGTKTTTRQALPPVNDGVRLTPRKSAVDKLSREERSMGQMMVQQGAYKSLEEYAASLEEEVAVIGRQGKA